MTDIDVSRVAGEAIELLSASQFELGSDAGRITWQNCQDIADSYGDEILSTPELIQEARGHFGAYGAWSRTEIATWADRELQALVIQEAAAEMRKREDPDFDEDSQGGRLYVDTDGRSWLYIGT